MEDYGKAWEALNSVSNGMFVGDHLDELTTDQRLKAAEVLALLSISQELSALNPRNYWSQDDDDDAPEVPADRKPKGGKTW